MREQGVRIGVVGITSFRPFPLQDVRAALGHCPTRARAREGARRRHRRDRLDGRTHGARRTPAPRLHGHRGPRGTTDHEGLAARAVRRRGRRPARAVDVPGHGLGSRERASSSGWAPRAPPVRTPRTSCAMSGPSRRVRCEERAEHEGTGDPLLPDGQLRGRQSPARSRAALGAGWRAAHELDHMRSSRLPGLRGGARRALRAGRRDARHERADDRGERDRLPGGVLHSLPGDLVADSMDPLAVRQRARRIDRHRRGAAGEGPRGRARRRSGWRRRHGGHRLRVPVGDVRAGRRRALHLLRQRGVHEHRRAALGRHAARRANRHDAGRRSRAGERRSARARARR